MTKWVENQQGFRIKEHHQGATCEKVFSNIICLIFLTEEGKSHDNINLCGSACIKENQHPFYQKKYPQ